jgi:Peptidase M15
MTWWGDVITFFTKPFKRERIKVTENFYLDEFGCKDGTPYPADWIEARLKPLCQQLEFIRTYFGGRPIRILSGFRTVVHNRRVGGSKFSRHLSGTAVDFVIKDYKPRIVAKTLRDLADKGKITDGGIGEYTTFTH